MYLVEDEDSFAWDAYDIDIWVPGEPGSGRKGVAGVYAIARVAGAAPVLRTDAVHGAVPHLRGQQRHTRQLQQSLARAAAHRHAMLASGTHTQTYLRTHACSHTLARTRTRTHTRTYTHALMRPHTHTQNIICGKIMLFQNVNIILKCFANWFTGTIWLWNIFFRKILFVGNWKFDPLEQFYVTSCLPSYTVTFYLDLD